MCYDIIGDIHGHADELELLLQKLGYIKHRGVYSHPNERKVVFLGDYIDRGPKIRQVLHIVKDMVEAGNAKAIMGNHEFNAIAFHTPNLNSEEGGYYRKHDFKEIKQHYATLEQFHEFPEEWKMFLNWFKELPVYLEEDIFRAVHACWDPELISWYNLNKDNFSDQFLKEATTKKEGNGITAYHVIEELLKGKEHKLPDGYAFHDKDGNERTECRVKWWLPMENRIKYGDVMLACPTSIAARELKGEKHYDYTEDKPVFFGHYWLNGTPVLENHKAICLDYSVAKGGCLVAFKSEFLEEKKEKDIAKGFVFVKSK